MKEEKEKRNMIGLKAKLYLGRIAQEKIGHEKFGKADIDNGIVICCDGLCCVLDFSKVTDPLELVAKKQNFKWMLREEAFGGLLWNAKSDHVFELSHDAFSVLKELTSGKSVEEVSEKLNVEESDIYQLFSEVTKNYR